MEKNIKFVQNQNDVNALMAPTDLTLNILFENAHQGGNLCPTWILFAQFVVKKGRKCSKH